MKIRQKTVTTVDVTMLNVALFVISMKNLTPSWAKSKNVCLQVKAIVKARVKIIKPLISLKNSDLNLSLPMKNLYISSFIFGFLLIYFWGFLDFSPAGAWML